MVHLPFPWRRRDILPRGIIDIIIVVLQDYHTSTRTLHPMLYLDVDAHAPPAVQPCPHNQAALLATRTTLGGLHDMITLTL